MPSIFCICEEKSDVFASMNFSVLFHQLFCSDDLTDSLFVFLWMLRQVFGGWLDKTLPKLLRQAGEQTAKQDKDAGRDFHDYMRAHPKG
jgi:hypothetical protein